MVKVTDVAVPMMGPMDLLVQVHAASVNPLDAKTRDGKLVSVNGTGIARVSRAAAKGTTYDAATGKLRASTRVTPGPKILNLSIFDQGDRQYDSAVFVDRLLVRHAAKCRSGLVGTK